MNNSNRSNKFKPVSNRKKQQDKPLNIKKEATKKFNVGRKENRLVLKKQVLKKQENKENESLKISPKKPLNFTKQAKMYNKEIRLNRYISNSGFCSRRDADQYISIGEVTVNGKIITELGTKVSPSDIVKVEGAIINLEKYVYVLLNKPKGYITTMDDPQGRKTVMELVEKACNERIYPVGRLDKNTTGLLLLTNDGDLTKKLTHPSHNIRKIYNVVLNKPLASSDMDKLRNGIELEDGFIAVDDIAYTNSKESKKDIGVIIHSGRNRIVRRMFEALGYDIERLDRTVFANITKQDLPKGKYRFLSKTEINFLKML